MGVVAATGAVAAWVGGALLVFSEGRRGLAAGLAVTGLGLAASLATRPLPAVVIAVAAVLAGTLRLHDGRPGWVLLPPGSTPRLLLALVTGVVGAFAATSLVPEPDPVTARVAVVLAGALAAARLLSTLHRGPALAALAGLCLVLAALEAIVSPALPGVTMAAGLGAVALGLLPGAEETADGT